MDKLPSQTSTVESSLPYIGDETHPYNTIVRYVAMIGEGIEAGAGPSLVAIVKVRSLKSMFPKYC